MIVPAFLVNAFFMAEAGLVLFLAFTSLLFSSFESELSLFMFIFDSLFSSAAFLASSFKAKV